MQAAPSKPERCTRRGAPFGHGRLAVGHEHDPIDQERVLANYEHGSIGMVDDLGGGRSEQMVNPLVTVRAQRDEVDI